MRFASYLEQSLVPEWKDQYLDYDLGKKLIKQANEELNPPLTTENTPLSSPDEDITRYLGTKNQEEIPLIYKKAAKKEAKRACTSLRKNLRLDGTPNREYVNEFVSKASQNSNLKQELIQNFYTSFCEYDLPNERNEFLLWLGGELRKVDCFYKSKEKAVYEKFLILEDQFFQLKEHRRALATSQKETYFLADSALQTMNIDTPESTKNHKILLPGEIKSLLPKTLIDLFSSKTIIPTIHDQEIMKSYTKDQDHNWSAGTYKNPKQPTTGIEFGISLGSSTTKGNTEEDLLLERTSSPQKLIVSPNHDTKTVDTKKCFRRYHLAKKFLKNALLEYYRKLALIQSYRTMNRTGFRKITKKYDKITGCSISKKFMDNIDKEVYFLHSKTCDQLLLRAEDIFIRFYYDENSEKEHFLEELKMITYADKVPEIPITFSGACFSSGLFIGLGLPLFVLGIFFGCMYTASGDLPEGAILFQIWGGFFLLNLCLLFIGITFIVYTHFKINYKFIFEFDLTNTLDYRQFFILPSLGFLLFCVCFCLSFSMLLPENIPTGILPLCYLSGVLVLFLWPGPIFFPKSRQWLQVSFWRILCSGLYPVEFRDFFLGNIMCSLTYSLSNFSLFICFYEENWRNMWNGRPLNSSERCGPSHSGMMGFLAALPLIWRLLHCVRRYIDTGDVFPHLFNMVKYGISASYFGILSYWRIKKTSSARTVLITVASLNSFLTSIWDIVMDWSLGQIRSQNFLLRDHLLYKKRRYYYLAMVLDIALRFQWILFLVSSTQPQIQAKISFCVALGEAFRRFVWMLIRMENEHCANMVINRASRDMALPYQTSEDVEKAIKKLVDLRHKAGETFEGNITVDETGDIFTKPFTGIEEQESSIGLLLEEEQAKDRRKSTLMNLSRSLKKAHREDFERKSQVGLKEDKKAM